MARKKEYNNKKPIIFLLSNETEIKYLKSLQKEYIKGEIRIEFITLKNEGTPNVKFKDKLKKRKDLKLYNKEIDKIYHIFDLESLNPKEGQSKNMIEYIKATKNSN